MRKASDFLAVMDTMFSHAGELGLMYRTAEDHAFDGRTLTVDGRTLLHFGSCSYLGLDLNEQLKQGAIDAILRYGTQFSASRVFMSSPLYSELEDLLGQVFGMPTLVAPSTTLGHTAAFPVLIQEDDAVILDQQVHTSVREATNHVRVHGVHVEMVRHNRMDLLAERIEALRQRHRHVWYLGDGVYSIYGDYAPMDALLGLLNRYEQFHVYLDDAHGMSWHGRNGHGYVLDCVPRHERLIVATSLNKAFAAGGGALVIPNDDLRRKVRTVGSTLVFSGPLQPASLGAAVASARLHLSDTIYERQALLKDRVQLCNQLLHERGLPLLSSTESPIRFIGTGSPGAAYAMVKRLLADGFFPNVSVFPAVPMKRAGIRFTVTAHHTPEDITRFVDAIANHMPDALAEAGLTLEEVCSEFELSPPPVEANQRLPLAPAAVVSLERTVPIAHANGQLRLVHHDSIEAMAPEIWDSLLGERGSFNWQGLRLLEQTFQGHKDPESNWKFHYFMVHDATDKVVLATFFTEALWKDDMIVREDVSRAIEQRRESDRYFLTSRTLAMGSLLTEGDHLYLDRKGDWRGALALLLRAVETQRAQCGAANVILRDFEASDSELALFFHEQGFVKFGMPESYAIPLDWKDEETFLSGLSRRARNLLLREVVPFALEFEIKVYRQGEAPPTDEDFARIYELYRNVKARSYLINTFELPSELFRKTLEFPNWELVTLWLGSGEQRTLVSAFTAFIGSAHYVPLVLGLDYRFVQSHYAYRQSIYQAIRRAGLHGAKQVLFGFGAGQEKQRFGAKATSAAIFVRSEDEYQMEVLGQMMADLPTVSS